MKYNQVLLKKNTASYRVFIPSEFATLGKYVKVKKDGEWENGWLVEEVSSKDVDESNLPDSHREIKSHRNKTGDSAPKDKAKREA